MHIEDPVQPVGAVRFGLYEYVRDSRVLRDLFRKKVRRFDYLFGFFILTVADEDHGFVSVLLQKFTDPVMPAAFVEEAASGIVVHYPNVLFHLF